MCFNYQTSIITFLIGTVFSILLIKKGNKKYILENKSFGIFFIFISLIQLMDFLFWIDINNNYGINKITSIIGPILNVGQPIILYIIKLLVYKKTYKKLTNFDIIIFMFNLFYLIYLIKLYIKYLKENELITTEKNDHLSWPWIKYVIPHFYLILLPINILYLSNFNYSLFVFIITYFFLIISASYFKYNIGELWCFFGSFIPIIIYFWSNYLI